MQRSVWAAAAVAAFSVTPACASGEISPVARCLAAPCSQPGAEHAFGEVCACCMLGPCRPALPESESHSSSIASSSSSSSITASVGGAGGGDSCRTLRRAGREERRVLLAGEAFALAGGGEGGGAGAWRARLTMRCASCSS